MTSSGGESERNTLRSRRREHGSVSTAAAVAERAASVASFVAALAGQLPGEGCIRLTLEAKVCCSYIYNKQTRESYILQQHTHAVFCPFDWEIRFYMFCMSVVCELKMT